MDVHDRRFEELDTRSWHDLVQLRVDVFVVEQDCAYAELDGRDVEPGTRHIWTADDRGPTAYLRMLAEADATIRLGRIVTRTDLRGRGLAQLLVEHALATSVGPHILDAQSHLATWYGKLGFEATGPEFVEDGIAHIPMRRR